MKSFSVRHNLQGWSNFFHFFQIVGSYQDEFPGLKRFFEIYITLLWILKLSMLGLLVRINATSAFSKLFGEIVYQLITLEFVGVEYIIVFLFSIGGCFTIFMLFYYYNRDLLLFHHSATSICLFLQDLSPIFTNYTTSCIMLLTEDFIRGGNPWFVLTLALICFVIFNIFTYLGASFHHIQTSTNSIFHSFWNHMNFFRINFLINLVQLMWPIRFLFRRTLFPCMGTSFIVSLLLLIWLSTIPYFTKSSNVHNCKVFGMTTTFIFLEIMCYAKFIRLSTTIFACYIMVYLWYYFLAGTLFRFFCKMHAKGFQKYFPSASEIESFINIPKIADFRMKILLHYATIIQVEDLQTILLAVIDADINDDITIECAKMLLLSSSLPHNVREKLFNIDYHNLSSSLRHFLCELQYEMNKFRPNSYDIEETMMFLQVQKQRCKIILYSFLNSLCDTHYYKYIYPILFNLAMNIHDFKLMCSYNFEGIPLSTEITNLYQDFLENIAGDVVQSEIMREYCEKRKISLIQTADSKPDIFLSESVSSEVSTNRSVDQRVYFQKSLEMTITTPLYIFLIVIFGVVLDLFLPPLTQFRYIKSIELDPDLYFDYTHSPSFFKAYFTELNIESFLNSIGQTQGNKSLFRNYPVVSFHTFTQYLNSVICPIDREPVFDAQSQHLINFKNSFYNLCSRTYVTTTENHSYYETLHEAHHSINEMFKNFENITERYEKCSSSIKINLKTNSIRENLLGAAGVLLVAGISIILIPRQYIKKMISTFKGIEISTLEELRTSLYVQIHRSKNAQTDSTDLDNDGILELEELEVDDGNPLFNDNDYSDLIDYYLKSPLELSIYDPAYDIAFVVYLLVIFGLKYCFAFSCIYTYSLAAKSIVTADIEHERNLNITSYILKEIDAVFTNLTYHGDHVECTPKRFDDSTSQNEDLNKIIVKWNDFIDHYDDYNFSEKIEIAKNLANNISKTAMEENINKPQYSTMQLANKMSNIYWAFVFSCTFIIIMMAARFYIVYKSVTDNIKRLILIIHSKYSSSESIMINTLAPFSNAKSSDLNMKKMSDLIVNQLRDPVIFFNDNLGFTGINRQLTVQLGYTNEELLLQCITVVFEKPRNVDFYEFIGMMSSPLGVRARRGFDLYARHKDGDLIPFYGTLVPIFTNGVLSFSMILSNKTAILEMKKEIKELEKKIRITLSKLVPQNVATMMMEHKLPKNFFVKSACFMAVQLKEQTDITEKDNLWDATYITQVAMSGIDFVIKRFPDIIRVRTFNGNFFFVCGLFNEKPANYCVNTMVSFASECAAAINNSITFASFFTGLISYGGPVYGSMMGVSKTLFEVISPQTYYLFSHLDIVPTGELVMFESAYKHLDNPTMFIGLEPSREVSEPLYVLHTYVGLQFEGN